MEWLPQPGNQTGSRKFFGFLFLWGSTLVGVTFATLGADFPLGAEPFFGGKQKRKSHKLFPFIKLAGKQSSIPIPINSIALRKANIVCNFGLSE